MREEFGFESNNEQEVTLCAHPPPFLGGGRFVFFKSTFDMF
jgi:hypothetical protein